MKEYEEPRDARGRLKFLSFHLLFGSMFALAVLGPLVRPSLLEGTSPEVIVGAYLTVASPLALTLGPFRAMWLARLLRDRPVRITDRGLTFPTGWLKRSEEEWIEWSAVTAVGSDFDPKSPRFKRRVTATIWLALHDGRVLARRYHLGEEDVGRLKPTLDQLGRQRPVLNTPMFSRRVGGRTRGRGLVLTLRIASILCVPFVAALTALLYTAGAIKSWSVLLLGLTLEGFILGTVPLWTRASAMDELRIETRARPSTLPR